MSPMNGEKGGGVVERQQCWIRQRRAEKERVLYIHVGVKFINEVGLHLSTPYM